MTVQCSSVFTMERKHLPVKIMVDFDHDHIIISRTRILGGRKINPFGFPIIWILLAYFAPSSSCQSQVPDSILKPHLARYLNIWISDIHIHEYQISKYMNIRYPDIWIWDIRIYEYQISGYMNIKYLDIWISKYLDIWTILAFCCSVFKPSVSQGWPPQAVCCSIYAPWRHQPLLVQMFNFKCSNGKMFDV